MLIPIPPIVFRVVVAVAGFLVGGWGAYALFSWLNEKKVAFIGMKGSGKSTALHGFQAVANQQKDWKADKTLPGTLANSKEKGVLGFEVCIDTSGAQEHKRHWPQTIGQSDVVFYFFDISRLDEILADGFKMRYYKAVQADLKDVGEICKEQNKRILVIATHTDLEYDKERARRHCETILAQLQKYDFVEGSLKDYASVSELCKLIEEKLK